MRVVYVSASGQLGGAERSLLDLMASVRAAAPSWSLHVVSPAAGPLVAEAEALGVGTTILPYPRALARLGDFRAGKSRGRAPRGALLWQALRAGAVSGRYVRSLWSTLRELAPDVVHTNGLKAHVLGAWTSPSRASVLWHVHDYVSPRPLASLLLRGSASRCAMAIANSDSVADDLRRVCRRAVPVRRVYNGVDVTRFSPRGDVLDLDAHAGLPPGPAEVVRVGLVATMAVWKGHETFLRALAELPPDVPVRGYLVGGPIYASDAAQVDVGTLRELAASLGIADRVGFTGFVDRPAAAMRALDVVVHASTQPEPFGLAILEGMACGRAVIVSDAGGAREVADVGRCALGHAPGDVRALAQQIARLARHPHLRTQLGEAARRRATDLFDGRRLADSLLPIYRELAPRAPSRVPVESRAAGA